jgi:hypothetical protein
MDIQGILCKVFVNRLIYNGYNNNFFQLNFKICGYLGMISGLKKEAEDRRLKNGTRIARILTDDTDFFFAGFAWEFVLSGFSPCPMLHAIPIYYRYRLPLFPELCALSPAPFLLNEKPHPSLRTGEGLLIFKRGCYFLKLRRAS